MENKLIAIQDNKLTNIFTTHYVELKNTIENLTQELDELKELVLTEMEANNLLELSNDELKIRYIAPTAQERFDSKKFREEQEELYNQYIKFIPVKAQLRITKK